MAGVSRNPYNIERVTLPKRMIFNNTELDEEQSKKVLAFLIDTFEDMAENIDEYTNMTGNVILTSRDDIEEKLKEVV